MIPKQLQDILTNLKAQKWIQELTKNSEIYIVGGSVRDSFLDKSIKDIDLVVDGISIKEIQKLLVPYGKQKLVGESFSVIKFVPTGHIGEDYDIAVPRIDKKISAGHKGFEIITDGVDIHEDLKRRDFTINSMAVNVITSDLLDPFNGQSDIKKKLIRATNKTAFIEDALRILRGIQFAARFNFDVESQTKKLMKQNSQLIKEISGERIFDEFQKILLKNGNTQIALTLIYETDIDKALFDYKLKGGYFENFENLDEISFYYILALIGNVDPTHFYMKRLKGESTIGKAIKILDKLHTKWPLIENDEEEKTFLVFKSIQQSSLLEFCELKPMGMDKILQEMNAGNIPKHPSDIPITGNEIMAMADISGPDVGFVIERIQRDALQNKFNWKNRKDSINYLQKILN